jgi:small subunit ribosomal protein S1
VSELAYNRVWRPSDVLAEGQEVEVKVLSVDAEKQRISLSLKALADRPMKPGQEKKADEDLALPPGAPKPPRKTNQPLKGGTTRPSDGEKFGLNW